MLYIYIYVYYVLYVILRAVRAAVMWLSGASPIYIMYICTFPLCILCICYTLQSS